MNLWIHLDNSWWVSFMIGSQFIDVLVNLIVITKQSV